MSKAMDAATTPEAKRLIAEVETSMQQKRIEQALANARTVVATLEAIQAAQA
jgi:hypothetical protein